MALLALVVIWPSVHEQSFDERCQRWPMGLLPSRQLQLWLLWWVKGRLHVHWLSSSPAPFAAPSKSSTTVGISVAAASFTASTPAISSAITIRPTGEWRPLLDYPRMHRCDLVVARHGVGPLVDRRLSVADRP